MAMPQPYADDDEPDNTLHRIRHLEAENERLRGVVRSQEAALRTAGKVLAPYLNRAPSRDFTA
jgi:hypothetical protein